MSRRALMACHAQAYMQVHVHQHVGIMRSTQGAVRSAPRTSRFVEPSPYELTNHRPFLCAPQELSRFLGYAIGVTAIILLLHIALEFVRKLWAERERVCGICGRTIFFRADMELDHIIPRGMGGGTRDDRPENLQLSHRLCNREKGSRRI